MVIKPKVRGFICTTAHPVGAEANVQEQIDFVQSKGPIVNGPKKVLILGSSQGFGLSTRVVSAFGCDAKTLGLFYEKPGSENKAASAGWYLSAALEKKALEKGLYYKSLNGDAFGAEAKEKTIATIKEDLGQVDLVVYSLAAPRRTDPKTGVLHSSVLKPIGENYTNKTVNTQTGEVTLVSIDPANEEEIQNTVKVMGGEDWELWIDTLLEAGVLADGCKTMAYSYIGPEVTMPIYRRGSIGAAKDHLEATGHKLHAKMKKIGGCAYVSVNKALVTQSSSAIPIIPLYIGILYKIMKEKGLHEGCIEQIDRLFRDRLYAESGEVLVDDKGRIRVDDWEMIPDIQREVHESWAIAKSENLHELADMEGYNQEFMRLFGFGMDGVDYDAEVDASTGLQNLI